MLDRVRRPRPSATPRSRIARGRSPGSPSSRTWTRRCPSASRPKPPGASLRRGVRGAARRARRAPVFLATLGPVAQHTARATFATNLLAAGGIAVEVAGATDGVEDVLAAYGGQPVVCLAGTDPAYAEWGAAAVAALRGAGATYVVIAGKPVEHFADDAVATRRLGVDALAFLTRTREELA